MAGVKCTGLLRTLIDVGRTASDEQAAVVLDAGSRLNNKFGRATETKVWRTEVLQHLEWLPPGPGRARALGERLAAFGLHPAATCACDAGG
ncbi:hypothetical protein, partial [Leucobacter chromiireducens]|uniref:hypothetical protein n=1 Tax=Leucobacter chromiireducens TaxID=283877 RepID=UPI0031CE2CE3